MDTFAFRCTNCGFLLGPDAAGENALPGACPHCGKGVEINPVSGRWSPVEGSWDVLADLSQDERDAVVAKFMLEPDQIVPHTPAPAPEGPQREPMGISREAN